MQPISFLPTTQRLPIKPSHLPLHTQPSVCVRERDLAMSSPAFSLTMLAAAVAVVATTVAVPRAEARAFFVFGDSLVDNGNNNYLVTTARADSPPYGIDYPTHRPTGRFSNGLNIADLIGNTSLTLSLSLSLSLTTLSSHFGCLKISVHFHKSAIKF